MLRTILVPAVVAGLLALSTPPKAHGYGVTRTGHTTVSPSGGVQHTASATATTPYGSYSGTKTGTTTAGGGTIQHSGSTTASGPYGGGGTAESSGYHTYSPTTYGGYSAAGSASASYSSNVIRYP